MSQSDLIKEVQKYRFYEFGDFCVDATRRALFRNGQEITLPAKAFELLLLLVQNEGQVFSHDKLLDLLWPDTFVEQSNLKKAVSALRKALCDSSSHSFYIKTIPRQGYCLAVPVRAVADNGVIAARRTTELIEVEEEIVFEDSDSPDDQPAKLLLPGKQGFFQKPLFKLWLAIILLGVIIGGYSAVRRYQSSKLQSVRLTAENLEQQKLTFETNNGGGVISPDGKYIAYHTREGENRIFWLRAVDRRESKQLTPPFFGSVWGTTFTPDGQQIYYLTEERGGTLYRVSILGGNPQKVLEGKIALPSFSADGKQMVYIASDPDNPDSLNIIKANSSDVADKRVIFSSKKNISSLMWSSDGQKIYYLVDEQQGSARNWWVEEIPVTGGAPKTVTNPQKYELRQAQLLKDNSGILFTATEPQSDKWQLWLISLPGGEVRQVTNDSFNCQWLSISDDGTKILALTTLLQSDIWVLPEGDLKQARKLTSVDTIERLGWTPDGRIVYVVAEQGKSHIWITGSDGQNQQQLSLPESYDSGYLSVTPDNRHVLFRGTRQEKSAFWQMDIDGKNPKQLTADGLEVGNTVASPDSKTLYFTCRKDEVWYICRTPLEGGNVEYVIKTGGGAWSFSPDAAKLAYCFFDPDQKRWRASVISLSDNKKIATFDFGSWVYIGWTADSQSIIYSLNDAKMRTNSLMVQPLSGGPSKKSLTLENDEVLQAAWSNDGQQLAITRGKVRIDSVLLTLKH